MNESKPTNAPLEPPFPPAIPPMPDDLPVQYEFNEAQNQVINQLAFAMVWVRVPLLVAGLLQAVLATGLAFRLRFDGAHIIGILGHAITAVVCFLLASWLQRAANAFLRVTTTSGRDITHLMTGLKNLADWFDILAFFVKMYLILLGVLLLILCLGLFGNAFRGPA